MRISVSRWLKHERNGILMLGSLGPGACLIWRHAHLAYVVFVCCRLSASSLPPTQRSGRHDIRTLLILTFTASSGPVRSCEVYLYDHCVVLVHKGTAVVGISATQRQNRYVFNLKYMLTLATMLPNQTN